MTGGAAHVPIEEFTVATSNGHIAVRERNAAGAHCLVLVHGISSNARWFDLVADRLCPQARVIALDLRGHGRAGATGQRWDLHSFAEDVAEVVAALGLERVTLVGHSLGATVALLSAATLGEVVDGVVCIDGGVLDPRRVFGATWETASRMLRPPQLHGVTVAALRAWAAVAVPAGRAQREAVVEALAANYIAAADGALTPRLDPERHIALQRSLWETDTVELVTSLRHPLLLLVAAKCPAPELRGRQESISELARLADVEHSVRWVYGGHHLPLECPGEVSDAIEHFAHALGDARGGRPPEAHVLTGGHRPAPSKAAPAPGNPARPGSAPIGGTRDAADVIPA